MIDSEQSSGLRPALGKRVKWLGRNLRKHFELITDRRLGRLGLGLISVYTVLAILGPYLAPYSRNEIVRTGAGLAVTGEPPSQAYPLGTTWEGYDLLSQILHALRTDIMIGLMTAVVVVLLGTNVGLVAGYYGGKVDTFLMRLTDVAYGLPLIPVAIVVLSTVQPNILIIALTIGLVIWRTVARVIRSEVLSVKEREYIKVAQDRGISDVRIMYHHIVPVILPLILLYTTISIAWGIIFNASISFLGYGDPQQVSLGTLLHHSFSSDTWLIYPRTLVIPAVLLIILIISVFFIAQVYEETVESGYSPE